MAVDAPVSQDVGRGNGTVPELGKDQLCGDVAEGETRVFASLMTEPEWFWQQDQNALPADAAAKEGTAM